ncbi:hypothetical protein [Bacillus suaedae]|uniref:YhfM-like domain-containing protein n=1 Tax=Halalkalibacter suaedae TaxID=2822140 RepID=A0A941AP92_9BACI|nr:hypothetical protein [Bacillus suaedae]MBP3951566.1 hypothetical protein [Bacillus suaedae]
MSRLLTLGIEGGVALALISICAFILSGCLNQGDTMTLLDEKITMVEISLSNGDGAVNEDILISIEDKESIERIRQIIQTSVSQKRDINNQPDYDIVVSYGDEFPKHAIHLWLGNEDEESVLTYLTGEGESYTSSSQATNQLRELIHKEN